MKKYGELMGRLRANAGRGISAQAIACREAAYAIEELLNVLAQARAERDVVTKRMIELEQENAKLRAERDAAVRELARYNDCVTCNHHCGGCSFELVAPEPCKYGWQWRGLEGK